VRDKENVRRSDSCEAARRQRCDAAGGMARLRAVSRTPRFVTSVFRGL
jgi:hypothetical protein